MRLNISLEFPPVNTVDICNFQEVTNFEDALLVV